MSKRSAKYDVGKEPEKIDSNIIKMNVTLTYGKYE